MNFDFMKNCLNGICFIKNPVYIKYIHYIVRFIALWVIVLSAWNSSVIINGACPHIDMELTVCVCVSVNDLGA